MSEQAEIENLAWWGADGLNYEEDPIWFAAWAAHAAVEGNAIESAALVAKATNDGCEVRCQLLRDVVGNPFRSTAADPSCLTHGVVNVAQAIYDERDFDRLPELAVALEEAGCNDAGILGHCRQPGPHVRGCWVVDLFLGKS